MSSRVILTIETSGGLRRRKLSTDLRNGQGCVGVPCSCCPEVRGIVAVIIRDPRWLPRVPLIPSPWPEEYYINHQGEETRTRYIFCV